MKVVNYYKLSLLYPIIGCLFVFIIDQLIAAPKGNAVAAFAYWSWIKGHYWAVPAHVFLSALILWRKWDASQHTWRKLILIWPILIAVTISIVFSLVALAQGSLLGFLGALVFVTLIALSMGIIPGYFYVTLILLTAYIFKKRGWLKD